MCHYKVVNKQLRTPYKVGLFFFLQILYLFNYLKIFSLHVRAYGIYHVLLQNPSLPSYTNPNLVFIGTDNSVTER